MDGNQKENSGREEEMYDEQQQTTVGYDSIINTFRLCYPKDMANEDEFVFGYCPLKLGVKTVGVCYGFYSELVTNSCRVKVSAPDLLKYLWSVRNRVELSVFSQN